MFLAPKPQEGDVPINEPATVELQPGERGTIKFEPKKRVSELVLPIIAISKHPGCIYQVKSDGKDRYGPSNIPPTDIDDITVTFMPALRFTESLTIEITNLGDLTRVVHAQPMGWEPQGAD